MIGQKTFMATRDDVLHELGLAPVWRRRTAGAAPLPGGAR